MGLYTLEELVRKWQHEQVTAEQMIGQLLQHVGVLYERLRLVERRAAGRMENAECRMQNAGPSEQPDAKAQRCRGAEVQRE
jgi:hypothetical protein